MERLILEPNNIPYTFDVILKNNKFENKVYTIGLNYNTSKDYITVDLSVDGSPLVTGYKASIGLVLFQELYDDNQGNLNDDYPNDILIFLSTTELQEKVTLSNIEDTVFMYISTRLELNLV